MSRPKNAITGIYKITNPNGKIYIGQSTHIKGRLYIYRKGHCKGQPKIYRSIIKYGFENHLFEIIEECPIDILYEREKYWGEYYNVLGENGLNLKIGEGKGSLSQESIDKMGISFKGRISPNLNNAWSEDSKDVLRKRILQYDKKGAFIQEWNGIKHAQKVLNTKGISMALNGHTLTSGGYIWKECIENYPKILSQSEINKHIFEKAFKNRKGKIVLLLDKECNILKEFDSVSQAAEVMGKEITNISAALNGKKKNYLGFIWKFKN